MTFDLGGSTIDIALGLSFAFFLLSIVASAITEGVAWATNQRAEKLKKGLKGMLGDDTLANAVLDHPLAKNDLSSAAPDRSPSYLSPRNFSLALTDILAAAAPPTAAGVEPDPLADVAAGATAVSASSPQLGKQLQALLQDVGDGDLADFRKSAEKWFDDTMERVSGWYKRWAQAIACVVALVVAVGLNASAVRIVERLESDQTVRSAVVAGAQGAAAKGEAPKATGEAAQAAVEELKSLKLPILWNAANSPFKSLSVFALSLVGWLITAIAISLGAPFWFDALGKLAHLRTAGKKPEPSKQPA